MNGQLISLIPKLLLGFVAYTLILATARNLAGQRGYNVVTAALSLAWWFGVDAAIAMLSFFLTVTAYRSWFPSEYLEDFPLVAHLFGGTDLVAADWMALVFTLLVFALAHGVAWLIIFVMQQVTDWEHRDFRPLLVELPFILLTIGAFAYLMYQWEGPILAVRTAELINDTGAFDNIGSIHAVKDIIADSWLLRSLYHLWPVLILFVSYGFTRAFLGFEAAINPPTAAEPDRHSMQDAEPAATVEPQPRLQPIVEPLAVGPREPVVAAQPPVADEPVAEADGHLDGSVQELIDQVEAMRAERDRAESERDALAHSQSQNPLSQRNRSVNGFVPADEERTHV